MNQFIKKILTIPWDPTIGFTKRMAPSSLNAFVIEEKVKEKPLPHQFEIKDDKVYIVNLPGYCPVIDRPLALIIKDTISDSITSTSISMTPFIGKTLHKLMILQSGSSCWMLHDENSRDHFLIKCNSSGGIKWIKEISDIDQYQGEKLDVFELSDSLLVVKYFNNDIIFEKWDAGSGEKLEAWREPKASDSLYQVQEEKFIGISFNSQQQVLELLNYNVSTRETTFQPLNNQYYGWFHHLIGIDRNRMLFLTQGNSLAKYSLEGAIIHQIDIREESENELQDALPDYTIWKVDGQGNIYIPYAEEAGVSIMKVQL